MKRGAAPAVMMMITVLAAACGEPEAPGTTLSWDLVDLEGTVVEIVDRRAESCRTDHCPRGIVRISDVVRRTASGDPVTLAETRFLITDDTRLLGCGPDDGREPITLAQFFDRNSHAVGEVPAVVWTVDGVDGEPPDPVRARQVVVGSCG